MGKTGISPEKGQEQNFLQTHWQGIWKGDPQKDGGAEEKQPPVRRRIFDFPLLQHAYSTPQVEIWSLQGPFLGQIKPTSLYVGLYFPE